MRFLVDAQLPELLSQILIEKGFDSIHVMQLPRRDFSDDKEIAEIADNEKRIVVTKDTDFYNSYMTSKKPAKLLLITTGNLKNRKLLDLIRANLAVIEKCFQDCDLVEMSSTQLIGHK